MGRKSNKKRTTPRNEAAPEAASEVPAVAAVDEEGEQPPPAAPEQPDLSNQKDETDDAVVPTPSQPEVLEEEPAQRCVCCPGTHSELDGEEPDHQATHTANSETTAPPPPPAHHAEEEAVQDAPPPTEPMADYSEAPIPKDTFRQVGPPREEYVIADTPRLEEQERKEKEPAAERRSEVAAVVASEPKKKPSTRTTSEPRSPQPTDTDDHDKAVPRYMSPTHHPQRGGQSHSPSNGKADDTALLQQRKPYRLTVAEIDERESSSRQSILRAEAEQRNQCEEDIMKGIHDGAWTEVHRAKYLESEVYLKAVEVGRQRRARVDEWEDQKAKALLESYTFKPRISRHASQRPSRTIDEFAKDNEEWQQQLEKRRRAASATVVREEDATFVPKILPSSQKIVERLQAQEKHVTIAFGWEKRMEEHRAKLLEIQLRHTPSFHPNLALIHHRPSPSGSQFSGESPNPASPPRPRQQEALIQRLYMEAIAHKKEVETQHQAKREASASPSRKKKTEDIMQHIAAMKQKAETAHRKLEQKRAKAERDEREHEGNPHVPIVNKHSAALVGNRNEPGVAPSYTLSTKAFERRRQNANEAHGAVSGHYSRTADERSKEFLLRSERTVQAKAQRVTQLQAQKAEEEVRECTFAPQISSSSKRYAEQRRSASRRGYDDLDGTTMWDATQSPNAVVPHLRPRPVIPRKTTSSSSLRSGMDSVPQFQLATSSSMPMRRPSGHPSSGRSDPWLTPEKALSTGASNKTTLSSHLDANMEDLEQLLQQWRQLEATVQS